MQTDTIDGDTINRFADEDSIEKDPLTDEPILTTVCHMRGIVDNFSDPISSILAKLYEVLLIRININIDIKLLMNVRKELYNKRNKVFDDDFFMVFEREENVNEASKDEDIYERVERMLFDIQNETPDNLIIYDDLAKMTNMDVKILANCCRDLAEIEVEYLFSEIGYPERMEKFANIIATYTDKMKEHLLTYGITKQNFDYKLACRYLKCVY